MVVGNEQSLSEYCAEVMQLIEDRSLRTAVAIGQHVLRHYPKYVGAYRVLARAILEQGEVGYAADLFKRVLSADPEDLEARVGLGIIYTEEEALEEALWQWERAFELAPGNSDIRARLRQVRERVEGLEFPRIELTRGALGRLYAKGGLFQQAADEFRAVLRKDPQQIDVQVALVETLWRDGKLAEAEAICEQVLDALPNCLKANLILGYIWLHTGREEESQEPFHIVHVLDPENQVVNDLFGEESPVPRETVLIPQLGELPAEEPEPAELISITGERLPSEWEQEEAAPPEAAVETELPDWLTQLREYGLEEEEEEIVQEEGLPDWLTEFEPADVEEPVAEMESVEVPVPEPETEPEFEFEDEELPDWLAALSAEEPEETVSEVVEEVEVEELLDAETLVPEQPAVEEEVIPDWLAAFELEEAEALPSEGEPGMPDVSEPFVEEPAAFEDVDRDVPDWLRQLGSETEQELADITMPDLSATLLEEDAESFEPREVPEWLQDVERESGQPVEAISDEEILSPIAEPVEPAEAAEEAPDWLAALQAEEVAEPEVVEEPAEAVELAEPGEEIPDWLADLQAEEVTELRVAEEPAEAIELAEPAEEIPDWLAELRPEEAAEPQVTEAPAEAEVGDVDLWREIMREEGLEEMIEAVPAEAEGLVEEAEVAEEVPDWLAALQAEEVAEPEVVEEPAEAVELAGPEEAPDWLAALQAEEPGETEVVEAPAEPGAEVAVEGIEPSEPAEEMPDWLHMLQSEAVDEEKPVEEVTVVEAPVVAEVREPEVVLEEAEEMEPAPEEEPVPDWLAGWQEEAEAEVLVAPRVEVSPAEVTEQEIISEEEVKEIKEEAISFIVSTYLERLETHPDDHEVRLALARAYRDERKVDHAWEQFEMLVKSGRQIRDLIPDLEGLCASYPDDVRWHQLLGDAYMRVNQLAEALEAYRAAQRTLSRQ